MRHGQTDWNLRGLLQGRTDIPLNDTGRAQAREAAERFRGLGHHWDFVVSSPLQRAQETAVIVAEALGIPFDGTRPGLIEQNFGEAEGTPSAEIPQRWPDRIFPGGELDADVGERGLLELQLLAEDYPSARVLAVCHGALIHRVLSHASGEAYERLPSVGNTSLSTLLRTPPTWRVLTVSDLPFEEALRIGRDWPR